MTYIFDMASGRQYPGDDLSSPGSSATPHPEAPAYPDETRPQLRLALREEVAETAREHLTAVQLGELIRSLDD